MGTLVRENRKNSDLVKVINTLIEAEKVLERVYNDDRSYNIGIMENYIKRYIDGYITEDDVQNVMIQLYNILHN